VAAGPAFRLRPAPFVAPEGTPGPAEVPAPDAAAELAALDDALRATADDVRRARDGVSARASAAEAAIFDAHLLFLQDAALVDPARARIREGRVTAARAWSDAVEAAAAAWDALDDAYQRARAADLRSVGDQVLRHLMGPSAAAISGAGILVAPDLAPAEAAALDRNAVHGVACAFGGPTSHGAILARSLGIPAVMAAGPALLAVGDGVTLVLDGEAGTVTVDPPAEAVRAAEARQEVRRRRDAEAHAQAHRPAVTRDGVSRVVAANLAAAAEVEAAVAAGADGVGLLRSEFLFLASDTLPSEDEQEAVYRTVAEALAGRPLTLRTLDAGADKPLPGLPLPAEANPFLGVRGIRLGLRHPEVLATQLRAALRVAADHPLRLLFPMVATLDELLQARRILESARATLAACGVRVPEHVEVGIMVEVPSAALTAGAFAAHVDFFSMGTNDLAQYVLAADRGNAELASLGDALHPAVLLLIDRTVRAAAAAGRWVGVCGELAGDPLAIPVLIGLGVRELSMAPARVPAAKQVVRETSFAAAEALARDALRLSSASDVRRLAAASAPV
jgi:phosphoenolpyruvate-protein phosphotransferase